MLFHYKVIIHDGIYLIVYSVKGNENFNAIKTKRSTFPIQFLIVQKYYNYLKRENLFCVVHEINNVIYVNYVLKGALIQSTIINFENMLDIDNILKKEEMVLRRLINFNYSVTYITNITEVNNISKQFRYVSGVVYDL
ncbi:hypothetical protein [Inconstantimicrobium mannanitabidum]|uniref:Uncharacterized protein n=1 Tax=Inconstantimicrobium mannanitabidum TaxID=1604901 RepID=A0ACB5RAS9_9CLOT|nr:hypothetical protein [Clostridium sp. TW13]GKX66140.1 hypothetical protein rsdtw13_13980 [Clostridium sp. TW13]